MTVKDSRTHRPSHHQSELPHEENSIFVLSYRNDLDDRGKGDPGEPFHEGKDEIRVDADPATANLESCDFETAILQTGYGKYNILLLIASIPAFFGCMNTTGSISLVLPSAECDLELSNMDKGLMNSVSYIGMICFAFVWGFLSDLFGRRKLLVIAFLLDVFFTVVVGLAQNFTLMVTAKLMSGFISAGPYAILMAYLAECHASKYRASVLLWTGTFGAAGTICLPALAWMIIPRPINLRLFDGLISLPSWRIFLLVTAVPSLLASVVLSFFTESPKFLMSRGRNAEAMQAFRKMYSVNSGKPRESFPVRSLADELKDADGKPGKFIEQAVSQIKPLFRKPYVGNAALLFSIQFCTLLGLNTMRLWTPQLFSMMIEKEKTSSSDYAASTICELLTANKSTIVNATQMTNIIQCSEHLVEPRVYVNSMIIGTITGIGYLGSGYIVAILGKKLLMISMYVVGGFCALGMYWSGKSSLIVGLTSVFITLTSISSTTAVSVIVDLVSTAQRSMGVSLTMMFGRSGAMVGNLTFGLLLDWNCPVLFFLIAAITFGSAFLATFLPRTKGAALK